MRYGAIVLGLVLALAAILLAEDTPSPPPAPQPVNSDALKGTGADWAMGVYEKTVKDADDAFQKQVKELQEAYMSRVKYAYKNYVAALRNAQSTETKKGNLDGAMAIKSLADAAEASGPPAAPAVEGAKHESRLSDLATAAKPNGGDLSRERQTRTVDLMRLVDTSKDAFRGSWITKDGVLLSDTGAWTYIEFPYEPPDEYDYTIKCARLEGNDFVMLALSKDAKEFAWGMGGLRNTVCGFEVINGAHIGANATTVKAKDMFVNNRPYTIAVKVRNGYVSAYLDGKLVQTWQTDYHDMSIADEMARHDRKALGIAVWGSKYAFKEVTVNEITGRGRVTRDHAQK